MRGRGLSWSVVARFFGPGDWSDGATPVSGPMVRKAYQQSIEALALKSEQEVRSATPVVIEKKKRPKRKKKRTAVVLQLVAKEKDEEGLD